MQAFRLKVGHDPVKALSFLPQARFSTGTRQSSKTSSAVSEAHQPIFFKTRVTSNPGVSDSITRRLTP